MEKRLHRLDTIPARGSDGRFYSVHAYEHLGKVDDLMTAREHWEPTGESEYKLADGRRVQMQRDGSMTVADSDLRLIPQTRH